MSKHREKFLRENSHLEPVVGSKFENVLRWAASKKFISFEVFEEEEFYSQDRLEMAIMWNEKESAGINIERD